MATTITNQRNGHKIIFTTEACEKKEGTPSGRGKSFAELDKEAKKKYASKLDSQNPKNGERLLDGLDTKSVCGSALEMHIWRYYQAGDSITQISRKLARDRPGEWGCDKRAVLDDATNPDGTPVVRAPAALRDADASNEITSADYAAEMSSAGSARGAAPSGDADVAFRV